ncbi:hypothetical protein HU200_063815 [Digitaria exilis]|uniref:Uncharacterized protein n=1 Tax=Digitaria exilis TaxID=1010633 RepID=A0A835DWY9_9POAL|nr:hypothetical protein HU200_063815 [Digitaria exilis]
MAPEMPKKAVRALVMLVTWEIWKERNARIFRHHESSALLLFTKIKSEASDWCLAGAKHLSL